MHDKYVELRKTPTQRLGHLVEECAEVLAPIGKIMSFGWYSVNPEITPEEQETNVDWLKRELQDLKLAITRMEEVLD